MLEEIDLVEEQDDRCVNEPLRIAYALEQHQSFLHLVLEIKLVTLFHLGDYRQRR